jgi:hypothetical protein
MTSNMARREKILLAGSIRLLMHYVSSHSYAIYRTLEVHDMWNSQVGGVSAASDIRRTCQTDHIFYGTMISRLE